MISNTAFDTDILIVGAGPVGLFLANECARKGLRYRIVETNATQSQYSKALAIFPRTLEIFDMAGVVAPFLERANRVTFVSVVSHGKQLAHVQFTPEDSPYNFVAMVPQDVTEQILLGELRSRGGDVEYQTTFRKAEQLDDHVVATLERNGQSFQLTAAFVVGCDGAHSAVRHLLDLSFEGGAYQDSFMLADVESNDVLPANELQLCPSDLGPLAIFPMSANRRRIVATVDQAQGDAPSLAFVQQVVQKRAPKGFEAKSLHWSSYFRIHHRHVSQLRRGRMFIAGDAAHIHSPFGGQGMNTGLQDVWNLAWKLDFDLRGHGGETLLDSYTAERLPVIKSVIQTTDTLTKFMGTSNKLAQTVRDLVIPVVSQLAPFQHAFVERMSELGIAYPGSPIIEGPGRRYFDDSIRGGEALNHRFVLFVGDSDSAERKQAASKLAVDFQDIVDVRISQQAGLTLVRPDGYVAYSSHHDRSGSAFTPVTNLLARQTGGGR